MNNDEEKTMSQNDLKTIMNDLRVKLKDNENNMNNGNIDNRNDF